MGVDHENLAAVKTLVDRYTHRGAKDQVAAVVPRAFHVHGKAGGSRVGVCRHRQRAMDREVSQVLAVTLLD